MSDFIGEFPCTLDPKGRVLFPRGLWKKLSPEADEKFAIKKGTEGCLELYPANDFKALSDKVKKVNSSEKAKRDFKRLFLYGLVETTLDPSGRLLIPKHLLQFAGIEKDIVMFGQFDYIEIWDAKTFEKYYGELEREDFAAMTEEVLGDKKETV